MLNQANVVGKLSEVYITWSAPEFICDLGAPLEQYEDEEWTVTITLITKDGKKITLTGVPNCENVV